MKAAYMSTHVGGFLRFQVGKRDDTTGVRDNSIARRLRAALMVANNCVNIEGHNEGR